MADLRPAHVRLAAWAQPAAQHCCLMQAGKGRGSCNFLGGAIKCVAQMPAPATWVARPAPERPAPQQRNGHTAHRWLDCCLLGLSAGTQPCPAQRCTAGAHPLLHDPADGQGLLGGLGPGRRGERGAAHADLGACQGAVGHIQQRDDQLDPLQPCTQQVVVSSLLSVSRPAASRR